MTKQTINYGNSKIPYEILYSEKQTRSISIKIFPYGTVQVKAPRTASLPNIKKAVYQRADWIEKKLTHFKQQSLHTLPREYISGESHYYLGRRYLLKLKFGEAAVKLHRGQLCVMTENGNSVQVKKLLWRWYIEHANSYFEKRLTKLSAEIPWLSKAPEWKLRTMQKQWGNCSVNGVITLNSHLIKAPRACIDYVIIHELCHLKVHNHSKEYYTLLDRVLPDWRATKQRLDALSEVFLNN